MGSSMSSIVRHLAIAAATAGLVASAAGAQLLPPLALPPVGLPAGNIPAAGPVVQDVLGSPDARQAISPTLDTVSGLTQSNRRIGPGDPARIAPPAPAAADPRQPARARKRRVGPAGAARRPGRDRSRSGVAPAGRARGLPDGQPGIDPALGLSTAFLAIPKGMAARDALRRLRVGGARPRGGLRPCLRTRRRSARSLSPGRLRPPAPVTARASASSTAASRRIRRWPRRASSSAAFPAIPSRPATAPPSPR